MKLAVCDDTPEDRQLIEKYLIEYAAKTGVNFELSFYESGEALLLALKKNSYHVIFLDIYMSSLTGIDTAKEIRKFDKDVQLIFVTASPDHAVSSYDVRALYYIMKPIFYLKIEKVLNLCRSEQVRSSQQITVLTGKNFTSVKLTEIVYAEMFKKLLTIHTTYGTIESRTSLEKFEQSLGGAPFLKCHRSFIVNMDFINDIQSDAFLLCDNQSVPISRPAKALALKTYNEYVFGGMRKKLC